MFSAPEQRRDWAQRGLLGAVLTQRNTVHFQGYPGLLWCNFPSPSLFPVKNFPGETYTQSIENWDLVPYFPATTSCYYVDEIPPEKQLQRESFIKVIHNHLSRPLGVFFVGLFLCPAICLYVAACNAGYAVSRTSSCLTQLSIAHLPIRCES